MSKLRFAAAVLFFVVASTFAQEYPARPVVMLVPFAAGGPTDTVARSLAEGMGKALKQTIVASLRDRDRLKTEIDKWTPIIRKAGVYAD